MQGFRENSKLMKKIFYILLVIVLAFSCKEEDNTPTTPIDDMFDPGDVDNPTDTTGMQTDDMDSQITLLSEGMFMGIGGHTAMGTVKIYNDSGTRKMVVLDPFSSQNGPDLKVYVSKDVGASQYISLGPLKSTNGKQSYEIPGNPDISPYKYVHIWCEQYSVEFARAEMQSK